MDKFIVVAGNIGAGKTTLVQILSQELGFAPFYEPVSENPYLADFYADMQRWAFHSQLYFLTRRLQMHRSLSEIPGTVLQDRSLYEDAEIFARNLFLQGHISPRDYQVYQELYQSLVSLLPVPNLVIYLRASEETLLARIARRGRSYEAGISSDYLQQLNLLYEEWMAGFSQCPVLIVNTDQLDLVSSDQHVQRMLCWVKDKLSGRTEVQP